MSGNGRSHVDARLESFFATLKKEKLYEIQTEQMPTAQVKSIVFRYIMTLLQPYSNLYRQSRRSSPCYVSSGHKGSDCLIRILVVFILCSVLDFSTSINTISSYFNKCISRNPFQRLAIFLNLSFSYNKICNSKRISLIISRDFETY